MKKRYYVIALMFIGISSVLLIFCHLYFAPTPIIKDITTSNIVRIQYNLNKTGRFVDVIDFDESKVLNYLNACKERKTLQKSGSYSTSDVTIKIAVRTDSGLKHILLGDKNYSSFGVGTTKHEIINSQEVTENLLILLNLEHSLMPVTNSAPSTSLNSPVSNNDKALDDSISKAIIAHNKNNFRGGEAQQFVTEYHEILKTVDDKDSTVVYALALYLQYQYVDNEIKTTGGSSVPVVLTFSKDKNNTYSLTDYWEPEDGEKNEQSIRDKFPSDIADQAITLAFKSNGEDICNQKAKAYFLG